MGQLILTQNVQRRVDDRDRYQTRDYQTLAERIEEWADEPVVFVPISEEEHTDRLRAQLKGMENFQIEYMFKHSVSCTETEATCSFDPKRHEKFLILLLEEMTDRRRVRKPRKAQLDLWPSKRK